MFKEMHKQPRMVYSPSVEYFQVITAKMSTMCKVTSHTRLESWFIYFIPNECASFSFKGNLCQPTSLIFFIIFSRQVNFSLNCPPSSLMNTMLNIKGKGWLDFIRFNLLHYSISPVLKDFTNLFPITPYLFMLFHFFSFICSTGLPFWN